MNNGTLKQILLITDGCSNSGVSPVDVAADAFHMGITVNVIGVLEDHQSETDQAFQEIEDIASAGGGIYNIVYKQNLSETVQAVTRQSMSQTLQGVVNEELTQIFGGEKSLAEVDPEKRGEVMDVVDELEETCDLEVLLLIDTSASMHHKLLTVKEALIDLSGNLHARSGNNQFCIYQFPAKRKPVEMIHNWSPQLDAISVIFPKLTSGGLTPTGSALEASFSAWEQLYMEGSYRRAEEG